MLSKREREFVEDWLKVVEGKIEKIEFYKKWGSKRGEFLDDYKKVINGEMDYEEFSKKWMGKGEWKGYIRVMRYRLKRKFERGKKDLELLQQFFELEEMP